VDAISYNISILFCVIQEKADKPSVCCVSEQGAIVSKQE
jgi:hypothetical protein